MKTHMEIDPEMGPVEEAVRLTIENNVSTVGDWVGDQPGSWGFLAGKAVIACRQKLGRKLTDHERRAVWHLLWDRLVELKLRCLSSQQ